MASRVVMTVDVERVRWSQQCWCSL